MLLKRIVPAALLLALAACSASPTAPSAAKRGTAPSHDDGQVVGSGYRTDQIMGSGY
jgi:hypothetical protein